MEGTKPNREGIHTYLGTTFLFQCQMCLTLQQGLILKILKIWDLKKRGGNFGTEMRPTLNFFKPAEFYAHCQQKIESHSFSISSLHMMIKVPSTCHKIVSLYVAAPEWFQWGGFLKCHEFELFRIVSNYRDNSIK